MMLILVSGGAASGKSAFAEELLVKGGAAPRIYLATMELRDAESRERAQRHRRMRAGKDFITVERPLDLAGLEIPEGCGVLLEDLGTLCANECFGPIGMAGAEERMMSGLSRLAERAALLVAVSNEIFTDGTDYGGQTAAYLNCLASLNRRAAALAAAVYEVVCGIPVCWKGAGLCVR